MNWLQDLDVMLTIVLSVAGAVAVTLLFFSSKFQQVHLDMAKIEKDFMIKLGEQTDALGDRLHTGPEWLKPLLESQQQLLGQAIQNGQVAIEVAKQHGEEMIALTKRVEAVEAKQDQLIQMMGNVCRNNPQ